jgi:hypothetical protein
MKHHLSSAKIAKIAKIARIGRRGRFEPASRAR